MHKIRFYALIHENAQGKGNIRKMREEVLYQEKLFKSLWA